MSIAQKILEKITDNLSVIAGGAAVAAVAAGAGYAAAKVVDDKKFEQRAGEVYELGVKKGVKLGSAEARRVFVDPLIARVAVSQYIALADGKISRAEQKLIDDILTGINANPRFPKAASKEIVRITNAESLAFSAIQKHLDRLDIETLTSLAEDISDIATASKGVSYKEQAAIEEFDRYLLTRVEAKHTKLPVKQLTDNKAAPVQL